MEEQGIEAVYQNGTLKLLGELPLQEGEKVRITIHGTTAPVKKRRGLIEWKGKPEDLDYLILAENNDPLEAQ